MKNFKHYLEEASFSRINTHLKGDRPVGMMTAFRGTYTYQDNKKRNKKLESDIRRAGLGYFKVSGRYIENFGKPDAEDVGEDSYFIIGNSEQDNEFKSLIKKLGAKYEQDSVLYKPGGDKDAMLIGTNHTADWPGFDKEEITGKWKPNKSGEFYSKMRGRSFVFESVEEPLGMMGRWAKNLANN